MSYIFLYPLLYPFRCDFEAFRTVVSDCPTGDETHHGLRPVLPSRAQPPPGPCAIGRVRVGGRARAAAGGRGGCEVRLGLSPHRFRARRIFIEKGGLPL